MQGFAIIRKQRSKNTRSKNKITKPSLESKPRIYHKSDSRLEKLSRAFWGVADIMLGGIVRMIALL